MGYYEIAKELLKRGADPDKLSMVSHKEPLCHAKQGEDNSMWLLINRAKKNAEEDRVMQTPSLLQAIRDNNTELTEELLQKAKEGQIIRIT